MKMNRWLKWSASLMVGASLAFTAVLLSTGCEDDPDIADTTEYLDDNPFRSKDRVEIAEDLDFLSVSPNAPTVFMISQLITLKVYGGYQQYTWRVSDATRGTITPNTENTDSAVYTSLAVAENTITVTDSGGRSATVNVSVRGAAALQIVPGEVTVSKITGTAYQFQQVGGVAPYTWAAANTLLGTVNGSGLYTVGAGNPAGTNTINLVDSAGDVATATVIQE